MIEDFHHIDLTREQRLASLDRARFSQPFFNRLEFNLSAGVKDSLYSSKSDVNKDFYLTEVVGNFSEAFDTTGQTYNVSISTALTGKSLYKFIKALGLPSGQIATEARFDQAFATQRFDDRQREYCPYHLPKGDSIFVNIKSSGAAGANFPLSLILKGYYANEQHFLNDNLTRGVNESLNRKIRFDTWKEEITHTGLLNYTFNNDRYARMVLGFGVVDRTTDKGQLDAAYIRVFDDFRNLIWNNIPMPIEFLAPRLCSLRDVHLYYLPVEYLLEPFASLRCEINKLSSISNFDLVMLTRTV